MRYLLVLLILCISANIVTLYANINEPINKPGQGNDIAREIGISITPIFTMDTVDPQILVVSPNGAEMWLMNTQKYILWSARDTNFITNPIHIMLSINNGENYIPIADSIDNASSYLWTVPNLYGPQSLIKIWATDTFGNVGFDLSDVVFTLPGTTVDVTPLFVMDTLDPFVDLLSPIGGETWYVGETNSINWTASDSNLSSLPITLEYKVDSSWLPIAQDYENIGSFPWVIPNTISQNVYVRILVRDLFGNSASDSSQSSFIINDATPAMVQNVTIAIIDSTHVRITWDPVTLTVQGNPVVPSGYLVLANSSNNPWDIGEFYVLGTTDTATTYLEENALPLNVHKFYRVVAVKNDKKKVKDIFAENENRRYSETHISWKDMKRKLDE